jgi:predicted NUDIX family NTP pyrophosphohydrolase
MGPVPRGSDSTGARARSAGIVLHRRVNDLTEVLLVHPGGPFWARRDLGVWSIPKGEYDAEEDPLAAALREFEEELGSSAPDGHRDDLGEIRQRAGKVVRAWAVAGDLDVGRVQSNTFELEWPPRSGRTASFPEVDRAEWFELDLARQKIIAAQAALLDRLAERLER